MKRLSIYLSAVAIFGLLSGCMGSGDRASDKATPGDDSPVYAEMDGKIITENDFMEELERISPFAKNQFKGYEGKKRMLDRKSRKSLIYRMKSSRRFTRKRRINTRKKHESKSVTS